MTGATLPLSRPEPARRIPIRVVVLAVLLVSTAATGPSTPKAQARGTIKIATQSPLSGELAPLGHGVRLAAQLALERLQGPVARSGFKVEVIPFDDQARPDVGVANAKTIIADREILVVIGHRTSSVAIPASEVYAEAGLAMISPAATDPRLTERGLPSVFRVCGRDDVLGAAATEFARDALRARSLYVVYDRSASGPAAAEFARETARKKGMPVAGFEGLEEATALDRLSALIKARNPDAVLYAGEYASGVALFRLAREQGLRAKLLLTDGPDATEPLLRGGDAVAGMHLTTVAGGVKDYPRGREFADEFRARFGKPPEPFAAQAYDATAVGLRGLEVAIQEGGGRLPSREAVARAIRRVKHNGVTGGLEFDERGDLRKATYLVYEAAGSGKEARFVRRLEVAPPAMKKP